MQADLQRGKAAEKVLDQWLVKTHRLWPATLGEAEGIDRYAQHLLTGARYTLQYKADEKAAQTGNAFIETVSVRRAGRQDLPGWAYSCFATLMCYMVVGPNQVYLIKKPQQAFSEVLPQWEAQYRSVSVPNKSWQTVGLLVPLEELAKVSQCILFVD